MPTLNPRVNVTLSPSLDALVCQFAGLQRVSKSMVLRELLETVEPSLRQVVALMEAAKKVDGKARKNIVDDMDRAIEDAEKVQSQLLSVAASATRDMVQEAETVQGRRPKSGAKAPTSEAAPARRSAAAGRPGASHRPPSSNRGVKS